MPSGIANWPLRFFMMLLSLWVVKLRYGSRKPGLDRFMTVLLLLGMLAGVGACGKGGGPLSLGTSASPLPSTSLTPSGTYSVSVTAAAGGLQKSVTLTVQVR